MEALLLFLQLQTITLCDSLLIENPECYEEVLECAYDEGDANWCFQMWVQGEL